MNSELNRLGLIPELQGFDIFKKFSVEEIEQLCADSSVVVTTHKKYLFKSGEEAKFFYLVLSGAYKLTKLTPLGEESILYFSTPGDAIAAFILTQQNPKYPLSSISMGPSRALKIPKKNYLEVWMRKPELLLTIQSLLSLRMANLQNQKALSRSSLQSKIATLLIDLIEKQPSTDCQTISLPLTRKEIADAVGSSVESIIRIMSEWSKKEFISTVDQQISIIQTDKIIQLMNAE